MAEMKNGLLIADEAIWLALSLEDRGMTLTAAPDGLRISNGAQLTEAERAAVKRLRWHLLAIAGYQPC